MTFEDDLLTIARAQRDEARRERDVLRQERDEARESLYLNTRTSGPRPLTADDITDEMVERGAQQYVEEEYVSWRRAPEIVKNNARESVRGILHVALTEPTRPEGAEKVEAVLHQYWSGDINGDDLADRIVEEMNR